MTDLVERIRTLWGSGFVNRWHTHPDPRLRNSQDTTAAHSQRVAVLAALMGESLGRSDAILAHSMYLSLVHDSPEVFTGDVPYHAKKDGWVSTDAAEDAWWERLGIERRVIPAIVKLADQLDAILYVKLVAPDLLDRDDWQDCINHTLGWAKTLGLRDTVEELING